MAFLLFQGVRPSNFKTHGFPSVPGGDMADTQMGLILKWSEIRENTKHFKSCDYMTEQTDILREPRVKKHYSRSILSKDLAV